MTTLGIATFSLVMIAGVFGVTIALALILSIGLYGIDADPGEDAPDDLGEGA